MCRVQLCCFWFWGRGRHQGPCQGPSRQGPDQADYKSNKAGIGLAAKSHPRHMFLFLSPFPFPPITRTLLYKFKLHAPPDGGIGYIPDGIGSIGPASAAHPPHQAPFPTTPFATPIGAVCVSGVCRRDARRATTNPHAPRRTPPHATDC
jgi:hypothetical protein